MKGRIVNIMLVSLQLISNLSMFTCLIINMGQDPSFSSLIKTFVTLLFICTIDDLFASCVSKDIKEEVELVNKH